MSFTRTFLILITVLALGLFYGFKTPALSQDLPVVAIANYGPHVSLQNAIQGIQDALNDQGFVDKKSIQLIVSDVHFDSLLIPTMITALQTHRPQVMITMGTPVTETAIRLVQDTPLLFNVVTDPVAAKLLREKNKPEAYLSGASDQQDLSLMLHFAQTILPQAERVGILYATSESNDGALVQSLKNAATPLNIQVIALPIDQARDIPIRIKSLEGRVDFIYVGMSGAIQPALPVIAHEAEQMNIPVMNADSNAVIAHQVLASFGVNYYQVGRYAGYLASEILNGKKVSELRPLYPLASDHQGFISLKQAQRLGIAIPPHLPHTTYIQPPL